jgi:hypothetical protein
MPELGLDADQNEVLVGGLLNAFNDRELDRLLRHFDRRLDDVAAPGPFRNRVQDVVDLAEREGWTAEFLEAARAARPQRVELQKIASDFGAAPAGLTRLERITHPERGLRDFGIDQAGRDRVERRICRIDVRNAPKGTGFLVGPDVVMTNFHVVQEAVDEGLAGRMISAVFGYKTVPDGRRAEGGTSVPAIDSKWLVGSSRWSPLDEQSYVPGQDPTDDYLDYALVALASSPGKERAHAGDADQRGWYELTDVVPPLEPGAYLFIAQHARGERLKFDDGYDAVIGVNGLGTRVRYTINTEPGSSGSPCFDEEWNLVALHHSGDPNYEKLHRAEYNEGIPMATIYRTLRPELLTRLRG